MDIELKMFVRLTYHQIMSCFKGDVKELKNLGYWTNFIKQKRVQSQQ